MLELDRPSCARFDELVFASPSFYRQIEYALLVLFQLTLIDVCLKYPRQLLGEIGFLPLQRIGTNHDILYDIAVGRAGRRKQRRSS